ncbi:hypothetical protein [Sulfitobacter sp.]|uniref:hypothetical protein n=1 Tax=Sulfitobacter sp. TaxID=1903071 RepID=UPI003000FFD3
MSQKRNIAIAGVALLAGLAFIENATRSVEIQPATVADVTSISPDAGPDLWTLHVPCATAQKHRSTPKPCARTKLSAIRFACAFINAAGPRRNIS